MTEWFDDKEVIALLFDDFCLQVTRHSALPFRNF